MKTIGILGGMGPEATADLYMQIVKIFQSKYNAKYDADFPPFVIYSLPLPDVVEISPAKEKEVAEREIVAYLTNGVQRLQAGGADFIAIACNTVQCYLQEMRSAVSIPILSVATETASKLKQEGYTKVGVLGTNKTINSGLFERECISRNIELIIPSKEQQPIVTEVIMNILAGKANENDKQKLKTIVQTLAEKGAEAIILGCTDLPLLMKQEDFPLPLIDTTNVMAQAVVTMNNSNGGLL